MANISQSLFLDINNQIAPQTQDLVIDDQAINNSLYNLLTTRLRTRRFRPDYGTTLMHWLHEPLDDITASVVLESVLQAIEKWEPRIAVIRSQSSVEILNPAVGFRVILTYRVVLTHAITNYTVEISR